MKKLLFITVLIFSLFLTTEQAYAYWEDNDKVIVDQENPIYTIEERLSNNNFTLIPQNGLLKMGDSHEIYYTYYVTVEESTEFNYGLENIELKTALPELEDYFSYNISVEQNDRVPITSNLLKDDVYGIEYKITVSVSMIVDDGQIDFAPVYGQDIEFIFTLSI